jgi:predicted ATP-grasp superfamily ATP-dependent carboligase
LSKEVTVSTLIALTLAFISGVTGYTNLRADVEKLQGEVADSTRDRIHKTTVEQMFENKDIQIQAVKADVEQLQEQTNKIDEKIDKNAELLLEIIRNMPRKDS